MQAVNPGEVLTGNPGGTAGSPSEVTTPNPGAVTTENPEGLTAGSPHATVVNGSPAESTNGADNICKVRSLSPFGPVKRKHTADPSKFQFFYFSPWFSKL